MFEVRAVLTVPELAKLANMPRKEMAKLLSFSGIRLYRVGRTRRVFLADLKLAMPSLWESLCELRRMGL